MTNEQKNEVDKFLKMIYALQKAVTKAEQKQKPFQTINGKNAQLRYCVN